MSYSQTDAIRAGYNPHENGGTMALPIYQSTAYAFEDADHAADLFALRRLGHIYTRLHNPTTTVVENRFAKLEDGAMAIFTASGSSAIFYSIINLCEAGDNFIAAKNLYGGSMTLFAHTLKRFGMQVRWFSDPSEIEGLIDDKTKAIFFESLSNPGIELQDFDAITAIAKKHKIITIVDNTVATPALFKPFEHGIDVAVYSASKYINGQGTALGGVIAERQGLNELIKDNPRYPHFNEPDESYHGLVYTSLPLPAFCLRVRLALLRDIGATPAPLNSWLFAQGLETLALRIKAHSDNALKIAEFLESHPKVKNVKYPGLKSHKHYALAQKYLTDGLASGLISFEVENFEKAKSIIGATKLFTPVVNIGDSKSLITHPASTTHSQMNEAELAAAGISQSLVRISVGLENVNDLIEDLKLALNS